MKLSSGFTVTLAVKVSLAILEPPINMSPGALRTGTDSPVSKRFINHRDTFKHFSIRRHQVVAFKQKQVTFLQRF